MLLDLDDATACDFRSPVGAGHHRSSAIHHHDVIPAQAEIHFAPSGCRSEAKTKMDSRLRGNDVLGSPSMDSRLRGSDVLQFTPIDSHFVRMTSGLWWAPPTDFYFRRNDGAFEPRLAARGDLNADATKDDSPRSDAACPQ